MTRRSSVRHLVLLSGRPSVPCIGFQKNIDTFRTIPSNFHVSFGQLSYFALTKFQIYSRLLIYISSCTFAFCHKWVNVFAINASNNNVHVKSNNITIVTKQGYPTLLA